MSQENTATTGELFVYISYISVGFNLKFPKQTLKSIRSRSLQCKKLIQTLDSNQVKYTVIDLGIVPEKINEMLKYNGGLYDLPQLFVDTKFIGTFDDAEEWIEEERFLLELQKAGYKGGPNPPIIDKEDVDRIINEFKEKFPDEVIKSEEEIKEKLEKIEKQKQERLESRKKPVETEKETKVSFETKEETQEEEESQYDDNYQPQYEEEEEEEEEEEYVRKYDPNRDSDDEYY